MTLAATLALPDDLSGLRQWAVIVTPAQMAEIDAAQQGQAVRLSGRPLATGDLLLSADWLSDEATNYAHIVAALSPATVAALRCARVEAARTLVVLAEDEPPFEWVQIAGADTGPQGAVSGYPLGALVSRFGLIWRSRVQPNANEPLVNVTSTWSREDGRYVVPAGWEFQPGEDLTADDGATWWRVVQATSASPLNFPVAYVQIDGPGGEPVAPPVGEWAPGQTVAVGDLRTFNGVTYRCRMSHTTQAGWTPPVVPSLWEIV